MNGGARTVLALGLEGTIVSNAVSQIPRPGLFAFLESARALFTRVVVFSSTTEARFRHLAREMALRGEVPDWFVRAEFVAWSGPWASRRFVPGAAAGRYVLLEANDDRVPPEEADSRVAIPEFGWPYPDDDDALVAAEAALRRRAAEMAG